MGSKSDIGLSLVVWSLEGSINAVFMPRDEGIPQDPAYLLVQTEDPQFASGLDLGLGEEVKGWGGWALLIFFIL